jgi:L-rhamnose 1-dehydrogenase
MSSPLHLLPSKTAAITGGTTGIGRAIALSFLSHGCNVAVNHLALASDVPHRDSLIAEAAAIKARDALAGELIDVPGDITLPETGKKLVQEVVDRWGRLDVFVSNAGICEFAEFLE